MASKRTIIVEKPGFRCTDGLWKPRFWWLFQIS